MKVHSPHYLTWRITSINHMMNDPKYSSLKTILIVVLVVVAGYFLYTTMTNREVEQSGLIMQQAQRLPTEDPIGSQSNPCHASCGGVTVDVKISKDNNIMDGVTDPYTVTKGITTNGYNTFPSYAAAVNADQTDEIITVQAIATGALTNSCVRSGGWTGTLSLGGISLPVTLSQFGKTVFTVTCNNGQTWVENSATVTVSGQYAYAPGDYTIAFSALNVPQFTFNIIAGGGTGGNGGSGHCAVGCSAGGGGGGGGAGGIISGTCTPGWNSIVGIHVGGAADFSRLVTCQGSGQAGIVEAFPGINGGNGGNAIVSGGSVSNGVGGPGGMRGNTNMGASQCGAGYGNGAAGANATSPNQAGAGGAFSMCPSIGTFGKGGSGGSGSIGMYNNQVSGQVGSSGNPGRVIIYW